jgi:hypothetical protein
VLCGGSPSSVQATDGGRIRARRFSFDEDHLLSGAGSDEEAIHLDGRFHGTVLSGWVEYARSWRCQGRAHYRANLVRTPWVGASNRPRPIQSLRERTPGGTANTALDVCLMYSLSASSAPSRRCSSTNCRCGSRW